MARQWSPFQLIRRGIHLQLYHENQWFIDRRSNKSLLKRLINHRCAIDAPFPSYDQSRECKRFGGKKKQKSAEIKRTFYVWFYLNKKKKKKPNQNKTDCNRGMFCDPWEIVWQNVLPALNKRPRLPPTTIWRYSYQWDIIIISGNWTPLSARLFARVWNF